MTADAARRQGSAGAGCSENTWIPSSDGRRLAARIWLPAGVPAAAILEAHPYRKRDFWRAVDEVWAPHLVAAGFAFVRVDLRGSGDSDGVLADEYLAIEHADLLGVLNWVARQPWCTGAVGLRGVSWGGIEALQVAALEPPALKALIVHCASDDRFRDDCHYVGGALSLANFEWGLLFRCFTLMPPDPAVAGKDWRRMWRERLDAAGPLLATWLEHQRDDAYWRRGSVAANYERIGVPVFVTSGWLDAYVDTVPRLLEHLEVPVRGLIGPWGHSDPLFAFPGPGVDWTRQETEWWDRWLRGHASAAVDSPRLSVFMTHGTLTERLPHQAEGTWIEFDRWPTSTETRVLFPDSGQLRAEPGLSGWREVPAAIVGLSFRHWLNLIPAPELLPGDQTADDARSLVFDSAPLDADADLIGCAQLRCQVRSDQPVTHMAARLCEVAPTGSSSLVSWALLNLTHRADSASPQPLVPHRATPITLVFKMRAHRFRKGYHIRLALSQGLWPLVWPAPRAAGLEFEQGSAALALPVYTARVASSASGAAGSGPSRREGAGEASAPAAAPSPRVHCQVEGPDSEGRARVVEHLFISRPTIAATGLTITREESWELETFASRPEEASWRGRVQFRLAWPARLVEIAAEVSLRADATTFELNESCRVSEDGDERIARSWRHAVPRVLL